MSDMKKLKIAEIITRLDRAGSPDIIRIICSSLNRSDYEIKLITGRTRYPTANTKKFLEEFKDNIIIVPWLRRGINPFFDSIALFSLYRILAKERFDIVHTHTAKAGALGRTAAYLAGNRRIIHMPHGHDFYGYFNPFISKLIILIERFLCRFTSKFVVLSKLEKRDLIEFGITDEEKIKIVPSGMDLEFKNIDRDKVRNKKRKFGFDAGQKIVGMVSRLEKVKGPGYFIEAAGKVVKEVKNARFLVVGEGSLRNKLENRVKELGLSDKVTFAGWREDVLDIISFLDILVQPSLNEAIGRVLLEAQGLGVPVIATKVGGIPEVVKDNITGILLPPQDTEKLVSAICKLLEDKERRVSMSKSAREWINGKFSAAKMMEEIESLYKEVATI